MTARIETVKSVHGICAMVVCVSKGVNDNEILKHCNDTNPSGTEHGWSEVVRGVGCLGPVLCDANPKRTHLIVRC